MPAGFNKGQIEYIKTIANVNGHKSYKAVSNATTGKSVTNGTAAAVDSKLKYAIWPLGAPPLVQPVGAVTADTNKVTDPTHSEDLTAVYYVPIQGDDDAGLTANAMHRVTPACFLEGVSCKMRHVIDLDNTIDAQSHKEFRLIVFRHREVQSPYIQRAENFSNPLYDMFHGASNRMYGPKGGRNQMSDDGNINYYDFTGYNALYDADAMMTDPVNTDDYVVMKDCRYYLGREYGGKHIYEDRFYWDHEDPIDVDDNQLDKAENEKNYCWYIMLLAHNNSSTAIDNLGYVRFSTNTHVTSG